MNEIPFARRPPPTWQPGTYAILVTDFRAMTTLTGGVQAEVRLDVRLTVDHPGPGFADDISSVMSYEDIIVELRRLCAEATGTDAQRLAEAVSERLMALPKVRGLRVGVAFPSAGGSGSLAGIEIVRGLA